VIAPSPTYQPQPTVRRHREPAARRLLILAGYALVAVVFTAPAAWLFHRPHLAVAIAVTGVAGAVVLACAACVTAARRLTFNPGPAAVAAAIGLAAVGWAGLPYAGLAWARLPVAVAAVWLAVAAARWGWVSHRRMLAHQRLAQVLEPLLSTSRSQAEQLAAGLTGVIPRGRERSTAPHLGAAPHAAWSVHVTRWEGTRLRRAVLIVPWLAEIRDPDFLSKIRRALIDRFSAAAVTLATDPSADKITITVLDAAEKEETAEALELARDRVRILAAQVLPDVNVEVLEWAGDEQPPPEAGVAWPLGKFQITYGDTKWVTPVQNRVAFVAHMGLQLFDDPGILRGEWKLRINTLVLYKRPPFPQVIPCRPIEIPAEYAGKTVIVYAHDEDGHLVVYQLSHTDNPHMLLTGGTGTGKTVTLRVIIIRAARQGIEVRGCDPKRIEMRGLRGWPNVSMIATRVQDMINLVSQTYNDMQDRYDKIETGQAHPSDFRRILLVIDEFLMFTMLINDFWVEQKQREGITGGTKEHPVMRKLRGLVVMGRSGLINIIIATQRGDATIFPDGVRDSLGDRVALGAQSKESAFMMFGDASVGRDIPPESQGVGHARRALPLRIKCEFLPDPADWGNETEPLSDEARQLLVGMLPPDTIWDGALPYTAPDPGFEGTAATSDVLTGDPATRLLFFIRTALRTGEAHLTDGTTGGAPAAAAAGTAAFYGWGARGDGTLEPSGTWVGCLADGDGDQRVYLHPGRAMVIATQLAGQLGVPFPFSRSQLDDALRSSGLLRPKAEGKAEGKETRWTVLQEVPGNDLPGKDRRQRVWDLPAGELLGDLPTAEEQAPAPAVAAAEWHAGEDGGGGMTDTAEDSEQAWPWPGGTGDGTAETPDELDTGEPPEPDMGDLGHAPHRDWAWPSDLAPGVRIYLPPDVVPDMEGPVAARVEAVTAAPGQPGLVTIDCWLADGAPKGFKVSAAHQIWLAP
jgi:FtsK/SpoIIIE family